MDSLDFMFPVEGKSLILDNWQSLEISGQPTQPDLGHKIIMRSDTKEVISIVPNSYRLITNEDLVAHLYVQLQDRQIQAYIDDSSSSLNTRQMRLQLTLPEIKFQDGDSEIGLSIHIHNSYDDSEPARFVFGGIRFMHGEGMVFARTMAECLIRHQGDVNIMAPLSSAISAALRKWPTVEEKVKILSNTPATADLYKRVEKIMGEDWRAFLQSRNPDSMWRAHHELSEYITFQLLRVDRAKHQQGVSEVFDL